MHGFCNFSRFVVACVRCSEVFRAEEFMGSLLVFFLFVGLAKVPSEGCQ